MIDASFSMSNDYQKQFGKDNATYYLDIYHQGACDEDYEADCWENEYEFTHYEDAIWQYKKLSHERKAIRLIREDQETGKWEIIKEDWPD